MSAGLAPWIWLLAMVVIIPAALWLLRRAMGPRPDAAGAMRTVAQLPLSASQRLLAVEVGSAEGRRWLILGVTPSTISLLSTLEPPPGVQSTVAQDPASPGSGFARLLKDFASVRGGQAR